MLRYLFVMILSLPSILFAHDVHYSIAQGQAYIVDIYYADGTKFAFESYELYSPKASGTAYQVGRTNALGRIVFVPDSDGKWLLKAFSEDGHGVNIEINVDKKLVMGEKRVDFFERFSKPIFGLGIILIIFSIMNIFVRKKEVKKSECN